MRVITTAAVTLVLGFPAAGGAVAGTTELVPGSYKGFGPAPMSADSHFVAFSTGSCSYRGCYYFSHVADRQTGTTSDACPNNYSAGIVAAISRDGRLTLAGGNDFLLGEYWIYV